MAAPFRDDDDPTDPRHLTPEQRLEELTSLLAKGVRRRLALHAGPTTPAPPPEQIDLECEQNLLDVPAEKSVHASRVVNTTREHRRS